MYDKESVVKIFENLESQYRAVIKEIPSNSTELISFREELNESYQKVLKKIHTFQKISALASISLGEVFQAYLIQFKEIHNLNIQWVDLYIDFCWSSESFSKNKLSVRIKQRQYYQQKAQCLWDYLEKENALDGLSKNEQEIFNLNVLLKEETVNSKKWRILYQDLSQKIYQQLCLVLIEGKYAVKNLFKVTLVQKHLSAEDSNRLIKLGYLSDWVRGYIAKSSQYLDKDVFVINQKVKYVLKRLYRYYFLMQTLKVFIAGAVIVCMLAGLKATEVDNKIWNQTIFAIQTYLKQDPKSLASKERKEYFQHIIESVEMDVVEERLHSQMHKFYDQKIYTTIGGYYFFAENILKDFFLIIPNRNLKGYIKEDIVKAAGLLSPQLSHEMTNVIALYEGRNIRESQLRKVMLSLRRKFVKHEVFPFMFLVVYNELPYVVLFPEPIEHLYGFSHAGLQKIGINSKYYEQHIKLPIFSYVVPGKMYPFKDRAGYFEGEFAIVFSLLSHNAEWTAHHELGHVTDAIRYKYEGIPIPKNIELNSMLFPVIFSKSRKDYIQHRLINRLSHPKIGDYYTQAARGILNGFILYLNEGRDNISKKFITNKFEKNRIADIEKQIRTMPSSSIRKIGITLFKHSDKYLNKVDGGRYISVITDTGEIILGGHGAAQRGFIVSSGWGKGLSLSGARFIRDAEEGEDNLDVPFDLMSFIKSVIRISIFHREGLANATRAEAIFSAVFVFVLFESFVVALHFLSAPIRKRKFLGKHFEVYIEEIYKNHPWSTGLSFGKQRNERDLLRKVFQSKGKISKELLEQVKAFKLTVNTKKRLLFDLCLCLAVENTEKSVIKNKLHDLLFFLPFIGPVLARSQHIFKKQKFFNDREKYNWMLSQIAADKCLSYSIIEMINEFKSVMAKYNVENLKSAHNFQNDEYLERLEKVVFQELTEQKRVLRIKEKWITQRKSYGNTEGSDFDRLDSYYPGDDIRRIDWRATMRLGRHVPLIRKYIDNGWIKVALLLDMRSIHSDKAHKQWAYDFVRSVNMLGRGQIIEDLIFILKDGSISEMKVNIQPSMNSFQTTQKVFQKIKEQWKDVEVFAKELNFQGFSFYTEQENQRFKKQLLLTDFSGGENVLKQTCISRKGMNIFLIGGTMQSYEELKNMIHTESQLIRLV